MMPPPMVPSEADLQDFPFMPLHVARLRDSDLAAEGDPEGCWYAVLLWAASWHQLPAGSLPDNDAVLTKLCGLGRDTRTWRKHRKDALRGFVLCDDGRLYHPVVAEQAVSAWESKLRQRYRTECARLKQRQVRGGQAEPKRTFAEWVAQEHAASVPYLSLDTDERVISDKPALSPVTGENVTSDIASKRQGQGEGQRDLGSEADASAADAAPITGNVIRLAEVAPLADPLKVMFDSGIALLGVAGISEATARKLLGRWRGEHGPEAVIAALGTAQREGAIDPKAFIEGVLRHGQRNRHDRPSGPVEARRQSRMQHPVESGPGDGGLWPA